MILDLKGIYKDYQQGKMTVPVLKDVDFSMEEGEYVAIMGPSGSGKTTLMNIIGCLDKPTKGTFLLNGEDIAKCTENEMSDIRLKIADAGYRHLCYLGFFHMHKPCVDSSGCQCRNQYTNDHSLHHFHSITSFPAAHRHGS